MLARAAVSFAARVLTGTDITWHRGDTWEIVAYAVWAFMYFGYSGAASGRTAGMALFGAPVARDDGTDASGRRAVVRTLALPLSFLFLGLGSSASSWGTGARRGCGSCPMADHAAASCLCRFFIRPGQVAARTSRRRSRWGSGCLLA